MAYGGGYGYGGGAGGYAPAPAPAPAPAAPPAAPSLAALFAAVDSDRSGQIDHLELQAALSSGGWQKFSIRAVKLMIRIFDRDRSGTVGMDEFGQLWRYLGDWNSCFRAYDRDGSGTIEFAEFQTAIYNFGYRLTPATVAALFASYDEDKSGRMGFDEFIQACAELTMMTNSFRAYDTDMDGVITINYESFIGLALSIRNLTLR